MPRASTPPWWARCTARAAERRRQRVRRRGDQRLLQGQSVEARPRDPGRIRVGEPRQGRSGRGHELGVRPRAGQRPDHEGRGEGRHEEAYGLLLRAAEQNPQALLVHLEMWRTLRALGLKSEALDRYFATAEESVFYRDPHVCTSCRYRADDMLWRCPHCHEWSTFVEERVGPPSAAR